MSSNEEPLSNEQAISDIDTARLALRGAVSTLRTLQDLMSNLKTENQDLVVRERAWKARVETMEQRLTEIHARWQESQTLLQNYKQEITAQIRQEIVGQEQARWQNQINQIQSTLNEWQKARDVRENELNRLREQFEDRENAVRRLEKEKIAFEHHTQAEITGILEKSRQKLQEALENVSGEHQREMRELRGTWSHEVDELKDALRRSEAAREGREAELQETFHQRRKELEALWRGREEEAWKQMETLRSQAETALQAQFTTRLGALDRARMEMQADFEQRAGNLESLRLEKEKALEALMQQKEAAMRERYLADMQDKEANFELRRLELEQQGARRETELSAKFRRDEEALRASIKDLEATLRRSANEEIARRKAAMKANEARPKDEPKPNEAA